jgi:LDH2 family malate/lactate/ureidoglycolate dehydrogenase
VAAGDRVRVDAEQLQDLVTGLFERWGLTAGHAGISARTLVHSDLRGHESHGVSNFIRVLYYPGLKDGVINPRPDMRILHESPTTSRWDADGAMGPVAGEAAMSDAIERARRHGSGFAAVYNSRHFGMAQHFAMMALEHDMIGMALTNGGPGVVPFQGMEPKLGTDPIAVAIPCGEEPPFVFDASTSTSAWGKIMNAARDGERIPEGWALDGEGRPTGDAAVAAKALRLLPLGSTKEGSGHKGYGLATMVESFAGALSGTGSGAKLGLDNTLGHFFGAWRIDAFMSVTEFKATMDALVRDLKATRPAPGFDRVMVAGQPEWETEQDRRANGIPLHPDVIEMLRGYAAEAGVPFGLG